jgi:hypothetical protein
LKTLRQLAQQGSNPADVIISFALFMGFSDKKTRQWGMYPLQHP